MRLASGGVRWPGLRDRHVVIIIVKTPRGREEPAQDAAARGARPMTVPGRPAQQTSDDQEFLMNTQDIVETWRREAIQEGLQQGLERERKLLLRLLRRRFGAEVDGETERRVAAAPAEQVEIWAERVLSAATLAELLAD
jgi:hypothetical protein